MSKKFILLILLLISFIPLCISEEEKTTETQEGSQNDTVTFNETEAEPPEEDPFDKYNFTNIISLDNSNYKEEIKKYEEMYVLFYATWCGHCHEFIPKFIETAEYCKDKIPNLKFIRIDGNKNENASEEFGVNGFPGIFYVYKGERHQFNGPREKEGLLYFRKRKMSGDIFKITKLEELKNFKNIFNTTLILLSTVYERNDTINISFRNFAKTALFIDFVSCLSAECHRKYGEDIILFKDFDEKENRYFANFGRLEHAKKDSVKEFASIYGIETGVFATQENINMAFEFEKQTLYYIRNTTEDAKYDRLFKEIGKELRPYNIYVYVCAPDANEIQSTIYNAFSITPDELPGIFYYDPYTNDPINKVQLFSIRHANMKKVNINYIQKFIKDIKDKKIKRDLYSEMPSDKKYINGMKYVIGKTYDKDVIEEKNNVLLGMIEGYGSETEDTFIQILGNLTLKYQNDNEKKIRFNIMNVNNNEPRDINANDYDFPRAYLFTNAMEKKEMIRFTPKNMSELNLEEFETFLIDKLNWNNDGTKKDSEKVADKKEKVKSEDKKSPNEDL